MSFQPLYVDTNIYYSMDMKMFPGSEDPHQVHQPTLLIATPQARHEWLSAMLHDEVAVCDDGSSFRKDVDNDVGFTNQSLDEDLYTLIESCNLSPCYINDKPAEDLSSPNEEFDFLEEMYSGPQFDSPNIDCNPDSYVHYNSAYHSNLQKLVDYHCGYISYGNDCNFTHMLINEGVYPNYWHACFTDNYLMHKQLDKEFCHTSSLTVGNYENASSRES